MQVYKPQLGQKFEVSIQFYNTRRRRSHKLIKGIDHKRCSTCRIFKSLDNFHVDKGGQSWDGLTYKCKICHNQYMEMRRFCYRGSYKLESEEIKKQEDDYEYQKYLIQKNKELDEIEKKGYDVWYWDSLERDYES